MNEHPETLFQRQIFDLARVTGWVWWHFHDSRREIVAGDGTRRLIGDTSAEGWVDLVLVGAHGALFRELKTDKGTVSLGQLRCVLALHDAGENADVWRPRDWPLIERTLTSKRPTGIDLSERIAVLRRGYEVRAVRAAVLGRGRGR